MDTYLPADFHALHDSATTDWRDSSTSSSTRETPQTDVRPQTNEMHAGQDEVDPSWKTL